MDGHVAKRESELYETDEYAWLLRQAATLRARRLTALDTGNLAEYLEDMGRSQVREAGSLMALLFHHLLKFRMQPERATPSWRLTVLNAQAELADIFESKTLRHKAASVVAKSWERARAAAAADMEVPVDSVPRENPFTLEDALTWKAPEPQPIKRRKGKAG